MSTSLQIAFGALGIVLLFTILIGVGAALVLGTAAVVGGGYGNHAAGEREVATDRGAAIEAGKAALQAIGARDIALDATTGALHARRPPSGRSAGEELTVRIDAIEPHRQRVTVESRSAVRGTAIDWRRNRRNVDEFLTALQETLPENGWQKGRPA